MEIYFKENNGVKALVNPDTEEFENLDYFKIKFLGYDFENQKALVHLDFFKTLEDAKNNLSKAKRAVNFETEKGTLPTIEDVLNLDGVETLLADNISLKNPSQV